MQIWNFKFSQASMSRRQASVRLAVMLVTIVDSRIRKLKTKDVVAVETVALQSVDDDRRLHCVFKISKTKDDFFSGLLFVPLDESDSLEARERPEEVRHLALGGVGGNSLDVDSTCGISWNRKDFRHIESRLDRLREVGERSHGMRRQRDWLRFDRRPRERGNALLD